jgi:hypothetical protein
MISPVKQTTAGAIVNTSQLVVMEICGTISGWNAL